MSDKLEIVTVPKNLYYHEVAYVRGLERERDALRAALIDARENIVEWAGYADAYFKDKYDYAGDLAVIDAALEAKP